MPNAGQPPTPAKKQLRGDIKLAADDVNNLLKMQPVTAQLAR